MSDACDDTPSESTPPAMGTANDRSAVPLDTGNARKHVDTPSPYAHLEEGWRMPLLLLEKILSIGVATANVAKL